MIYVGLFIDLSAKYSFFLFLLLFRYIPSFNVRFRSLDQFRS